jgi:hypothetical protein
MRVYLDYLSSNHYPHLMILAIRPFGFRTFLNGLGHDNILSLLLVASVVAVILVMVQRIGLIFPDEPEREQYT